MAIVPRLIFGAAQDFTFDDAAPTLVGAVINGTGQLLTLTASKALLGPTSGNNGITVTATDGAVTITYLSGQGTAERTYAFSRQIKSPEDVTISLSGSSITSLSGIPMSAFTGLEVDNASLYNGYWMQLDVSGSAPGGAWSTAGAGLNWNGAAVADATKSFQVSAAPNSSVNSAIYTGGFPTGQIWSIAGYFEVGTMPTTTITIMQIRRASDAQPQAQLRLSNSSGGILTATNGAGTGGVGSLGIAAGNVYRYWADSNEDGEVDWRISATGIRPAEASFGSSSNNAGDPGSIVYRASQAAVLRFAKMRAASSEIGSNFT